MLEARSYSISTDSGNGTCPSCNKEVEFRVRANAILLGYTYWAGSLHFESVETYPIKGLRTILRDGTVIFELNGRPLPGPGLKQ